MSRPKGFFHEYRSTIDGSSCVAIFTVSASTNSKTSDLIQSDFLRADIDPVSAVSAGSDASVCGDCVHRATKDPETGEYRPGSCYVVIFRRPLAIWKCYRACLHGESSRYARLDLMNPEHVAALSGRSKRYGSYGEAASVPASFWRRWHALVDGSAGHTGYTHRWRELDCQHLRPFLMASVDSLAEKREANALGWRTFRVRSADEPIERDEFSCPASLEAGKRLTCAECLACDGAKDRAPCANVTIISHGATAKRFQARDEPLTSNAVEFLGALS